jgi:hypothetical protein
MSQEYDFHREAAKTELLGQILVRRNMVTQAQLQEAVEIQKSKKGGLLGDILLGLGYISEELLAIAIAYQQDICYMPVEKYKITKEALNSVVGEVALKYTFIPVEKINNLLTVAIAGNFTMDVIREIEAATKHKISPIVSTRSQILKLIKSHYGLIGQQD